MLEARKSLGQHFLKEESIARRIVDDFSALHQGGSVLEIGPGPGVLTGKLLERFGESFYACELDQRMVTHLHKLLPGLNGRLLLEDFLNFDWNVLPQGNVSVIGNFPYNISTEIVFRILDNRERVPVFAGMFQKEVAKRFASVHGNKEYGITSVLLQAWYDVQYLFDVPPEAFAPPPKVQSGVIACTTHDNKYNVRSGVHLKRLVKAGFNQRRKTLRNALSGLNLPQEMRDDDVMNKRAEQLSVERFVELSNQWHASLEK